MKLTSAQNKLILEIDERLRERERQAAVDPEARAAYRQELRRKAGLEQVEAIRCIGIYRTDDYSLDSHSMFFGILLLQHPEKYCNHECVSPGPPLF